VSDASHRCLNGAYLSAERLIRSTFVSDSKIMRFLKVTMICLGGLVLTLILTEVLSDTLGYFLFSSGFFGLNYDSAFPLAIVFSFVISVVCVVTWVQVSVLTF
jgi:hypothetical protein